MAKLGHEEAADHSIGNGGELHQAAGETHPPMSSQRGLIIADDENSLKANERGPVLIEDHLLIEKTQHFDHERIPERVVHARGYGAKGYFELTDSLEGISKAGVLTRVGEKTPAFVRFSTVAGNAGSSDLARDVRGFAVKMYTPEGNWDIVGNNIPVFFIQDSIKFTDLIHSVKQEPDRGFPQAQSAHDTFWDFVSLVPESTHMLMWIMSDRAIPRSFRMMEGFGVHTFRLINNAGKSTYVKFHWRPKLGMESVIWDEALKISGADPDFHRRDLWNAIDEGNFPEWELGVQLFDEEFAQSFDFDVLDATKLIPEETLPLRIIGKLVLDRNVDNYFAETEQVAFATTNVVPGIDFSNDPLLQGRNLSYIDTQLTRLGTPNYQQIPVNAPRCPVMNMQRDGHHQMLPQKGRVSYSPSSLEADAPRPDAVKGFSSFKAHEEGDKMRVRAASFADHFSQALQFFNSQTEPEQNHIVSAFIFELSKVETKAIRTRMLGQLANVDATIAQRVADGLGMTEPIKPAATTVTVRTDLKVSPALSIVQKMVPGLKTKLIGVLIADGTDAAEVLALETAAGKLGAKVKIVAPKIGGATTSDGKTLEADFQLAGGASVLFDAVFVALSEDGAKLLSTEAAAVGWVHDAFSHLKVIGATSGAQALLDAAGVVPDEGVLVGADADAYLSAAANGRIYDREPNVRTVY
ncbi:catalase [Granulicella tundricola]|uniref:Catalase n=1 Tax=Granulicella tundricola (strain ATCC BAA-1859 / DSM 23138 / MP5ACTX9) TaxID=1198114 RepID=E8WZW4_GRATM|nr:catalase [Granulicella tundricola]ADW67775.1 Catalase [Granulicella tundricola MP5ACTX9]